MKVKLSTVLNIINTIMKISNKELPFKVSYGIARNYKILESIWRKKEEELVGKPSPEYIEYLREIKKLNPSKDKEKILELEKKYEKAVGEETERIKKWSDIIEKEEVEVEFYQIPISDINGGNIKVEEIKPLIDYIFVG